MKLRYALFVVASAFFSLQFVAADGNAPKSRYALVVGNSAYQDERLKLATPVNDARDISKALTKLGYKVDLKENITEREFKTAIKNYVTQLGNKDNEGFFWYGGHGMESEGQNYLLPVDVDTNMIRDTSVSLQQILADLDLSGNKMNVVVIDACRDNLPQVVPQTATRSARRGGGMSEVKVSKKDVFVMMSTAPGQSALDGDPGARNSPFAMAFLTHVNSLQPLQWMASDIINETEKNTADRQHPYTQGSVSNKHYSINPAYNGEVQKEISIAAMPNMPKVYTEKRDISFVEIDGGTFTMGSSSNEFERNNDEVQHQVTVNRFLIADHELTQEEYQAVMGINPSKFRGAKLPVESVTWYDAIEYCNMRSELEGLELAYNINKVKIDQNNSNKDEVDNIKWIVTLNKGASGYRLPTEAEWEYACRAGLDGPFDNGNKFTTKDANFDGHYPWNPPKTYGFASGKFLKKTVDVKSYKKNRWGIYDMHGNIREWCWDWYGDYPSNAQTDPLGASSGKDRVLRGGSWYDGSERLRAAKRRAYPPSYQDSATGFRLVRSVP
ncbi:MAG: hypothetical protein Ta2B_08710 [Termitinemataceae bacterium]|nr:MAG: hypothetical protein Ta2B_08710 [Termitinemataceae bacterium]